VSEFDERILRVGIEIDGQLAVYEELAISVTCSKFGNPLQNECEVKISNLTREHLEYLLRETSPFNANRTAKRIVVEAGRQSTGTFRVFQGDITECAPTPPPDIALKMKAKTGQFSKGRVISTAHAAQSKLSTIAARVAQSLGLVLVFEADDKNISNYSFSGGALNEVRKLSDAGNVNAYVDDDRLIVKNYNVALQQTTHVLSKHSGMIGQPEITEQGVKVKYFLDPKSQLGGALTIESESNPAASGEYVIYKLSYELTNRDTAFYCIAECKRKGAK
jgi:hypothetical protein